jgi:hypothetical protein
VTVQSVHSDDPVSVAGRKAVLLGWIAEAAGVALLPIAAVWLFNISIIDQESYVDPEFYTGYGQSFERMWQVFGLTYYAARFPVMFLNTTTQRMAPGFGGYALAHYISFLVAAIPFYLLARRHFGRNAAAASYAFLVMNPLFPRIISWDLTTSLSIPAGLGGIALWLLGKRAWGFCIFAAGFMFAVALNSHIFTGTAIGVFLATEFFFSLFRRRGILAFIVRALTATAGAVTCVLLGLWFYQATVGPVTPAALWEVTAHAMRDGQRYAETHYVPLADYYARNYEIYVPLVMTVAALALGRGRLFTDTVAARITWFAVAYLSAYVVAVFVLRMNIVQYFWYFGHLTIAVYLTVPVVLRQIADKAGSGAILWFTGTLAIISLTVAAGFPSVHRIAVAAAENGPVAFTVLGLGILAIALLSLRHRRAVTAGAVMCAIVAQASYLSWTHLSVYNRAENAAERPIFEIIREYHRLLNRYDKPDTRVRTWYQTSSVRLLSVASSNLLFTVHSPWSGPGMPTVGQTERGTLIQEQTRYVLLMADDAERIDAGLRALTEAQVRFSRRETGRWGYPPAQVSVALIELMR